MPTHWLDFPTSASVSGITRVQHNSGSNGSSTTIPLTASLPGASTTGNQLLLAVCSDAAVNTPSGWSSVVSRVSQNGLYLYKKTSAGESNVTITPVSAASTCWYIVEYSGLNLSQLQTVSDDRSDIASQSTGTTDPTTGATNGLAFAAWGMSQYGGGTNGVASMSNGFAEVVDLFTSKVSGTNVGLAVGLLTPASDGTFSSTATFVNNPCNAAGGIMAVFAKT